DVLATLTVADTGNGPVLLYPLRRSTHRHPFFRIPRSDEVFYLFDILRTTAPDPAAVQAQVAANRALYEQAKDMDGSRYCIGTIPFTQRDWKEHYGPTWLLFVAAKLAYDPQNVLTPGQGIFSY
ncbi:MAG: oxidoreductase, partial [Proteobacteria bacterium]